MQTQSLSLILSIFRIIFFLRFKCSQQLASFNQIFSMALFSSHIFFLVTFNAKKRKTSDRFDSKLFTICTYKYKSKKLHWKMSFDKMQMRIFFFPIQSDWFRSMAFVSIVYTDEGFVACHSQICVVCELSLVFLFSYRPNAHTILMPIGTRYVCIRFFNVSETPFRKMKFHLNIFIFFLRKW